MFEFSWAFKVRTFVLIYSLFSVSFQLLGQSPDVASINRVIESPVSMYSGAPQIGLPLGGISGRSLRVGVGLSYNPSGVRVEDYGSWTGINWNLSAGGMISRSVQGIDDFAENGFYNVGVESLDGIDSNCEWPVRREDLHDHVEAVLNDQKDSGADVFYFSMPGGSGKFIFNSANEPVVLNQFGITIEKPEEVNDNGLWTITTLDGTKYIFGGSAQIEKSGDVITAWYLNKIISTIGEEASFYYDPVTYTVPVPDYPTRYHLLGKESGSSCESFDESGGGGDLTIRTKYLNRIVINESVVKFSTFPRCDLRGGRALEKVQIFQNNDELVKEYRLAYECDFDNQRLWLTSVQEVGGSGAAYRPTKFQYYNKELLPPITSSAQDHWGFYNGATNASLIPAFNTSPDFYFEGANRDTHLDKIRYGTLQSVTYPTGGVTEYEFEPHEYEPIPQGTTYSNTLRTPSVCLGGNCDAVSADRETFTFTRTTSVTVEGAVRKNTIIPNGEPSYVKVWFGRSGGIKEFELQTSLVGQEFTDEAVIIVPPGTYEIVAEMNGVSTSAAGYKAHISAEYKEITSDGVTNFSQYGGGLRVNKITTFDGEGNNPPIVKRYEYIDPLSGLSSGKLMTRPQYFYYTDLLNLETDDDGNVTSTNNCTYLVMNSSSIVPLSTSANGSFVGYSKVIEYEGEAEEPSNGRIIYEYHNEADLPNPGITLFDLPSNVYPVEALPYAPATVQEPLKGYVSKSTVERVYNNTYYPIQETEYNYSEQAFPNTASWLVYGQMNEYIDADNRCKYVKLAKYRHTSSLIHLESTTSTTYDGKTNSPGQSITSTSTYTYDTNYPYLSKSSTTTDSEGVEYISKMRRVTEFDDADMGGAIGIMKQQNLLGAVIEQQQWRKTGATEKILSSGITIYEPHGDTTNPVILPKRTYASVINEPQTSWPTYDGVTVDASRYDLVSNNSYDDEYLLTETTDKTNQIQSFIYGYTNDLPIASVSNSPETQIAYTSFEKEATDSFNEPNSDQLTADDSWTGDYSYTGDLTKSGLIADNYQVALWAKGAGETITVSGISVNTTDTWTFYRWTDINPAGNGITILNSGAYIDEVRIHPMNSFMQTTTYKEGVGISSSTDANGKSVFYEYDGLNRRYLVKDHEKNVVNRMSYHFKGVPGIIEHDPLSTTSSANVTFLGGEERSDLTFSWDFGDGQSALTGRTVDKTFTSTGNTLITLSIYEGGSLVDTYQKSAFVSGTLSGDISYADQGGRTIDFSVSNDASNADGTTYSWNFDDGTPSVLGASATHQFDKLGKYRVELTISHPLLGTIRKYADVVPTGDMILTGLIARFSPVEEDESIDLFTQQSDINPYDVVVDWDLGDGASGTSTGTAKISHIYTEPDNVYTVSATLSHPYYSSIGPVTIDVRVDYGNPVISGNLLPLEPDPSDNRFEFDLEDQVSNGRPGYTYYWQTVTPGETNWVNVGTRTSSTFAITITETKNIRVRIKDQNNNYSEWKQGRIGVFETGDGTGGPGTND